jgi:uncharacterized membrane protein
MDAVKAMLGIVVTLAIGDVTWLSLRNDYHTKLIESIQKTKLEVRWIPAIAVYVIIVVALYLGAVQNAKSLTDATLRGSIVGLLLYAFYDLTNYATLVNYTLEMTVIDITWGTLLCAAAATAGFYFKATK